METKEKVLASGELMVLREDGETLDSSMNWRPISKNGAVHEMMWTGDSEEDVRNEVLDAAHRLGASLVVWRVEPCVDLSVGAYAIAGLWRPRTMPIPRNNNGRSECFWCGKKTEKIQGFTEMYDMCRSCGK